MTCTYQRKIGYRSPFYILIPVIRIAPVAFDLHKKPTLFVRKFDPELPDENEATGTINWPATY